MGPVGSDIQVFTMVVDEEDYLRIWLRHWRRHLPDDSLNVLIHGPNPDLERLAAGVNVRVVPRPEPYETMEEDRWTMLSDIISERVRSCRVAIYTDVDEILVADPRAGIGLADLLWKTSPPVAHTTGLEVIHRLDEEPEPIDLDRGILHQRRFFRPTSFHSKPCIIREPVRWGRGGHFTDRPGMSFARHIYTLHLRFYDMDRFLMRAAARRATTMSRPDLRNIPHRRWRNSAAEAEELVAELQGMKLPSRASLSTWGLRFRMRRTLKRKPNDSGLYRYGLFVRPLQRFPDWMVDCV